MRPSLVLLLLFVPALAFSQARMHAVMTHPPSPADDVFGGASGNAVGGTVSAVNGNLISIAHGLVVIDATGAKITGSIAPGDLISALLKPGDVASGAPLPAAFITVIKVPDAQLTGPVQAIDTTKQTLAVLGTTIHVTPQTRFEGPIFGMPVNGLANLQSGDYVYVAANVSGGQLVADTIAVKGATQLPVTHIHGKVKSIAGDSWTIIDNSNKDFIVKVTSDTKIVGSPVVGSTVDVLVSGDASAGYVALAIVGFDGSALPIPQFATYHGTVKSISPGTWVVHDDGANTDRSFLVWAGTKIDPGIQTNQHVVVQALKDPFGNLVAYTIQREP